MTDNGHVVMNLSSHNDGQAVQEVPLLQTFLRGHPKTLGVGMMLYSLSLTGCASATATWQSDHTNRNQTKAKLFLLYPTQAVQIVIGGVMFMFGVELTIYTHLMSARCGILFWGGLVVRSEAIIWDLTRVSLYGLDLSVN